MQAEAPSVPVVTPLARRLFHSTRLGRGQRCGMHRLGLFSFGAVEENEVRGCARMYWDSYGGPGIKPGRRRATSAAGLIVWPKR